MQANLEAFERLVYARKRENHAVENQAAHAALMECLKVLREGGSFEGHPVLTPEVLTRMASAIVSLFVDPGFGLTEEGFNQLCGERNVIDTVFQASVYGSADFVFNLITSESDGLNKFLLLSSINSKANLDWQEIFKAHPQETVGLWLSLVGYGQVFNPDGDSRREKLLALYPLFENCSIPNHLLNTFTGAYMHCSYAHGKDKHTIKRVLHKMLRNTVNIAERTEPLVKKDRPTMLILFEWWHRRHAMYRSYARSIAQLRKDFHLIGMCPGKNTDDEAKSLFDEWVPIDGEHMILTDIAGKIQAVNPDIIYYPSIGMAVWVIAMASFRLAPIQVMSYGHPATTYSPCIDYGIIEEDTFVADRFSEKVLTLPANVVRPTEFHPVAARHTPRKTDVLKIGVTAMQVKVSWPFVKAMQEVSRRASKRVEFTFFPAVHGVGLYSFCRQMGALLQNSTIQQAQPYEEYMQSLSECDIALFSFPFGGTNSTIDSLILGLPMVSLLGTEPHSMSDAALIRRAGLPESLVAKSEDEYIEAILKMQSDEYRGLVAELVRGVDVQKKFFQPDDSQAFLETFRKIYKEKTA